jgi:hypothetical protein
MVGADQDDDNESIASSGWGGSSVAAGDNPRVRKVKGPKTNKAPMGDQQQALVGTISDIVSELMTAYKQGRTVNMLRLKQRRIWCTRSRRRSFNKISSYSLIFSGHAL